MANEPTPAPKDVREEVAPAPTLNYHTPVPQPNRRWAVLLFIVGFGLAAGSVAMGSAMLAMSPTSNMPQTLQRALPVLIYAPLTIICIFLFVRIRRHRTAQGSRPFLAGLLLGTALIALIEGICFVSIESRN
jgi:hypothetical protein